MKLVTGTQMQALDRQAIESVGIPSAVLMENAGRAVARAIGRHVPQLADKRVVVASGKGNNGGDGLVVARALLERGVRVEAFVLAGRENCSEEAARQWRILAGAGCSVVGLPDEQALCALEDALARADVLVDALLGIGVRGAARGHTATAIRMINGAGAYRVAVDVPSGLDANTGGVAGDCVRADLTVTLGLPKTGLLFHPGAEYVGALEVVPIGYPDTLVEAFDSGLTWLDRAFVAARLPARPAYSHKGTFGRALLVGGSAGMSGALALAGRAALRSGVGLVHLAYPETLDPVVSSVVLEAVKHPLPSSDGGLDERSLEPLATVAQDMDAVAIGPGLGRALAAQEIVRELVSALACPLVVDADGLNALAGHLERLKRAAPTVLTPHPGEFARLTGLPVEDIERDRLEVARDFATEHELVLVLKGVPTVIATPNRHVCVNATGNAGLAKGGSGDVLTGLIAGLIAQGMGSAEAAACGAWLHGRAADSLQTSAPARTMTPGELVDALPNAFPT